MKSVGWATRSPRLLGRGVVVVVVVALSLPLMMPTVSGAGADRSGRVTTMRVSERDFHITAPKRIAAGKVRVRVHNVGPDDHELYIVRGYRRSLPLRADGLTVDEEKIEEHVVDELEGGQSGSIRSLRAHLRPGPYEMFCNMSGHYLGGMHTRFVVER